MARVHEDTHGLFVRAGGYLFRPDLDTEHRPGDTVAARHLGGTQWGRVGSEVWRSHGAYATAAGRRLASDEVFQAGSALDRVKAAAMNERTPGHQPGHQPGPATAQPSSPRVVPANPLADFLNDFLNDFLRDTTTTRSTS